LVIFSSASRRFVESVLERSKIDKSTFKKIYISREDFNSIRGKDPWMYKQIAKNENFYPSECAHIGDSMARDYYNSKKAGFNSFIIEHEKIKRISFKELEKI